MSVLFGAVARSDGSHLAAASPLCGFSAVMPRLDRGIQYAAASPLNHRRLGVLDRPVKPGDDTESVGAFSPNPAQLSHFATLFPLVVSFGTRWERIAAESLTPLGVPLRSRNMSREPLFAALDGVLPGRTSGVARADSLKLGMARSRIRIGEESNGFGVAGPAEAKRAKTTPCTVGMSLKSLAFIFAKR